MSLFIHHQTPHSFRVAKPLALALTRALSLLAVVPLLYSQGKSIAGQLEGHYNKGLQFFQAGNLEKAETEFQHIVTLAPQVPEPYYFLAKIAASRNALSQAETLLKKALRLKPDFVEAHHTLGVLCMQQKKVELARDSFLRAIQLNRTTLLGT